MEVLPTKPAPCSECPWRVSNWGRTDRNPDFYTAAKRRKMWSHWRGKVGVRDGVLVRCHKPLPGRGDAVRAQEPDGTEVLAETVACECAAAVTLQQREAIRYGKRGECAMTEDGVLTVVRRMLGNPKLDRQGMKLLPRSKLLEAAHPSLADPGIGHDELEPPVPGEFVML